MISHSYNTTNYLNNGFTKMDKVFIKYKNRSFDARDETQRFLKVPEIDDRFIPLTSTVTSSTNKTSEKSLRESPTNTLRVPWKIVVLGNAGVGKTSLVRKFLTGNFSVSYNPTVEDSYLHNIKTTSGIMQCVEILDTSGFYEFPAMRELNIRLSAACILVFDVNCEDSLNSLIELNKTIKTIKSTEKLPMIVVGNKLDNNKMKNKLITEKATKLAQDLFKCPYFETSAKDNFNVDNCFNKIVELINEQLEEEKNSRRESLNQVNSNRRNSSISFVRRISVNTSPKRNLLARRYSEPVVKNEASLKIALEAKAKLNEESMNRKRAKNCVIS